MRFEDVFGDPHRQPRLTVLDEVGPTAAALALGADEAVGPGERHKISDLKRHRPIVAGFTCRL